MKFCSSCGKELATRIPPGDSLPRYVCDACDTVHYQNPRMIVGCLPYHEHQVLLCRRAIEPRRGLWTLPSGFLENGEKVEEGAMRETWEEARARVRLECLQTVYSIPHINQVYLLFVARLTDLDFGPGPESTEVELFAEDRIPWTEIAFSSISFSLRRYFEDIRSGAPRLHLGAFEKPGSPGESDR